MPTASSSPDRAWRRAPTVHARVPPAGGAEALVDLLRATWPSAGAAAAVRAYEDCDVPAAQAG
ncbi:hypothetical protein ABZ471_15055 [Streptomyces sp. NPDC005728]|uniref:hypothetical protein n=1 Tax=Streptomyces sp. NPDC005728 TaxID=3157054 RepID=UPI003408D87F